MSASSTRYAAVRSRPKRAALTKLAEDTERTGAALDAVLDVLAAKVERVENGSSSGGTRPSSSPSISVTTPAVNPRSVR